MHFNVLSLLRLTRSRTPSIGLETVREKPLPRAQRTVSALVEAELNQPLTNEAFLLQRLPKNPSSVPLFLTAYSDTNSDIANLCRMQKRHPKKVKQAFQNEITAALQRKGLGLTVTTLSISQHREPSPACPEAPSCIQLLVHAAFERSKKADGKGDASAGNPDAFARVSVPVRSSSGRAAGVVEPPMTLAEMAARFMR